MTDTIEEVAFEALARHPRFADLVALTRAVALRGARARALSWQPLAGAFPQTQPEGLTEADAATDFGNAWVALERGPKTREERGLLRALWAHALAEASPSSQADEDELAAQMTWLAAFTPFDATLLVDRAMGEAAEGFFAALSERLRRIDSGEVEEAGWGEAIAAALVLRASSSPAAEKQRGRLVAKLGDPVLIDLLARDAGPGAIELKGEVATPPRHPAATVALALTGLLFVAACARLVARLALGYRRPADLIVTASAVRVRSRTVVLGRTLRDRDVSLPRSGLVRAVCEVRYARAAFYAGLLSLAVGSLCGVRVFVDGVRAASPSLLFVGLAIVAAGVAFDYLLAHLGVASRGRCRVMLVGRDRTSVCVQDVDAGAARAAIARLAQS
jgi:hypothetical protein